MTNGVNSANGLSSTNGYQTTNGLNAQNGLATATPTVQSVVLTDGTLVTVIAR